MTISVLSAPLADPVPMSFAQLSTRDVVLVEVEADGVRGVGESWVNYPPWATTERLATLQRGVMPLLVGLDVSDPIAVQAHLVAQLGGVARQWGAPGPVWQAISAVDMALWDLAARTRDVSVSTLLGARRAVASVPAYASGVGPSEIDVLAAVALAAGCTAVKTRVGFGRDQDERTLVQLREAVGTEVRLYADANQAWSLAEAQEFCVWSRPFDIVWLEEPLAGNDLDQLGVLSRESGMLLACGENLYGLAEFERYADSGAVGVIQPDLAKSGGFSLAAEVARRLPDGVMLAPHCYGGALVTAASVQLAAAFEVVGCVELDVRPNPLRDELLTTPLLPRDGMLTVPQGPGLGVELDRDVMESYLVERVECELRAMV